MREIELYVGRYFTVSTEPYMTSQTTGYYIEYEFGVNAINGNTVTFRVNRTLRRINTETPSTYITVGDSYLYIEDVLKFNDINSYNVYVNNRVGTSFNVNQQIENNEQVEFFISNTINNNISLKRETIKFKYRYGNYFNGRKINDIYFNGTKVNELYFNGTKVN